MSRHDTRLSHAARIERTLSYIADHLDDPLDVETLASVAAFSPCHFHRIFTGVTGETVGEAVRRLRFARAASDLGHGSLPIARVARRAGYGSVAAFARAFGERYGIPPAAFRQNGKRLRAGLPRRGSNTMTLSAIGSAGSVPPLRLPVSYDVEIVEHPGAVLVALPHRGDYNAIGQTFSRLMALAGPRGLLAEGQGSVGVYHDDPLNVPTSALRSHAGLVVPADTVIEAPFERVEIPAGTVARLVHKGPYTDLDVAYAWLYRVWLPASSREPRDVPCFEEYLNDPSALPPTEWLTRVNLPLTGEG